MLGEVLYMIKKQKTNIIKFNPVKLYFDDIDEIFQLLSVECSEVVVSTDDYVLSDINQLKDFGDKVSNIEIITHEPFININIGSENHIFASQNSIRERGIADGVKEILEIRKRKFSLNSSHHNKILSYLGFPIFLLLILSSLIIYSDLMIYPAVILAIAIVAIFIYTQLVSAIKTVIFTKKKIEMPNFWTRNKDQLITSIISGSVGAILGFLLTFLLK
jgi:hypothetical protein